MADRYRHLLDGREQDAADRLDGYFVKRLGRASAVVAAAFGHHPSVSTIEDDDGPFKDDDELLEAQEHKGYGDDEGERESSFDDDDAE
jgi:hypothetical protein